MLRNRFLLRRALFAVVPTFALGVASAFAQNAPLGLRNADTLATQPTANVSTLDLSTSAAKAAKKKTVRRNGPPVASGDSLPPLIAYPGAERIGLRGGISPRSAQSPPPPTIAAVPSIDSKRRPPLDDKPYDPTGVSFAGLRLKPYLEEDFGYASNPSFAPSRAKGSAFENTEAGLTFQSDWVRNEIHGSLRGGYSDYFADSSANAPYGSGSAAGRLDVSRSFSLDSEAHFSVLTQTPGSVTLPSGAVLSSGRRPLVDTYGGSAGGTAKLGNLALSVHGAFDRTAYYNTTLSNGVVDQLSSDDSNDWGLRGRIAYRISPIVTPFLEASVDKRIYDKGADANGFQRGSTGESSVGGVTLAWTNQLTGEFSAGYGNRTYQDARLPDLRGPLVNGSLAWSVTPLTTVSVKAGTSLADTTTPGASGAASHNYTIGISHALLRNLTLSATAGYATDVYSGLAIHDETTTLGVGAEYNVSRELVIKSTVTRTQFSSSLPNSSYVANVFMLGLRLQR